MLKKNELYTVSVTDLNNLGFAVAKLDGMTVFVGGAADGDEARIRIIHVNKTYAVARMEELVTPSPHRTMDTGCAVRGCGGCAYRAVSYAHEKELKENYVRYAFRKAGLSDVTILPLVSTDVTEHYRNKAQYAVAKGKNGECVAGFFAPKSHRLTEAVDCPLAPTSFPLILRTLLDFANTNGITPYDEQTGEGLLRHIYLRASHDGRVLLTLVINGRTLPAEGALISLLQERHPEIIGVYLNIHTARTNVICSEEYRHIAGEAALTDTLCGVKLSLAPAAFYQVNHDATELLYRHAARLADFKGDEMLLDLYSGVGSIGLSMAHGVRSLVGVEIVAEAVACATQNARVNGIDNARFFSADAGDVEALLDRLPADPAAENNAEQAGTFRPDVVILDPPRKGCAEGLLHYLAERLCPQKIVYISCNPDTLARDARILSDLGYSLSPVTPFDLFPRTGHVESVVCLTRRLDVDMRR